MLATFSFFLSLLSLSFLNTLSKYLGQPIDFENERKERKKNTHAPLKFKVRPMGCVLVNISTNTNPNLWFDLSEW